MRKGGGRRGVIERTRYIRKSLLEINAVISNTLKHFGRAETRIISKDTAELFESELFNGK